jgi:hypothetical protein
MKINTAMAADTINDPFVAHDSRLHVQDVSPEFFIVVPAPYVAVTIAKGAESKHWDQQ